MNQDSVFLSLVLWVAGQAFISVAFAADVSHIDHDGIQKTVALHADDVTTCSAEAAKRDPKVSGKVVIKFVVGDQGEVSNARGDEGASTVKDPLLFDCLSEKIHAWRFPAAPTGAVMDVSTPFTITPPPAAAASPDAKPEKSGF